MDSKLKISALEQLQKDGCCHYWIIESPKEGVSKGACRYCGAVKAFSGYWVWTKGDASVELNINPA